VMYKGGILSMTDGIGQFQIVGHEVISIDTDYSYAFGQAGVLMTWL